MSLETQAQLAVAHAQLEIGIFSREIQFLETLAQIVMAPDAFDHSNDWVYHREQFYEYSSNVSRTIEETLERLENDCPMQHYDVIHEVETKLEEQLKVVEDLKSNVERDHVEVLHTCPWYIRRIRMRYMDYTEEEADKAAQADRETEKYRQWVSERAIHVQRAKELIELTREKREEIEKSMNM